MVLLFWQITVYIYAMQITRIQDAEYVQSGECEELLRKQP